MSNAELAAHFRLSEATVKTHVARILAKLRLRDRAQAVVVAYERDSSPRGRAPRGGAVDVDVAAEVRGRGSDIRS